MRARSCSGECVASACVREPCGSTRTVEECEHRDLGSDGEDVHIGALVRLEEHEDNRVEEGDDVADLEADEREGGRDPLEEADDEQALDEEDGLPEEEGGLVPGRDRREGVRRREKARETGEKA